MKKLITLHSIIFFGLLTLTGCAEFNDPYPSSYGGYNEPYYGGGYHNDDYYRRREYERDRHEHKLERRELERERARVEEERRRLEEQRAREAARSRPQPREERCPSGFSPSENKCSAEERRRGCKDMRLPGGLGCVRR